MRQHIKLIGLCLTLFPCLFASAQTNLTGPVILNGGTVLDLTNLAVPTAGTYVIASGARVRGEYILSVEAPYIAQTVHLLVVGGEFDPRPTLQILDNHSYSGAVAMSNFRLLTSPSNGYDMYLAMDVTSNLSTVAIQYQGDAEYTSAFGGILPSDAIAVGGTGLAVNETSVGIGTNSPSQALEVNGNAKIDGSVIASSVTFPDGTSMSSAASVQAITQANGLISVNGDLQVTGNVNPNTTSQGGYLGWNAMTGGTGETDFINNQGNGYGGFAFFNTPNGGTPRNLLMFITGGGNVGIGTSTPAQRLEVNGNLQLTANSGASVVFQDGTVQTTAWNGTTFGGDYAESVDVTGDRALYEPGDVITINDSETGTFIKSSKPYSKLVAGVFSTKPGLVGRRTTVARIDKDAEVPMAMMGIVPTKVTAENGSIEPGDLLVSSSTPGYAMKATDPTRTMGAVIGKALAPLKSGSGVIEVLISLQ